MQDDDHDSPPPKSYGLKAAVMRARECGRKDCKAYGYCQNSRTCKVACHAGRDGECTWDGCPQRRDKEPEATGRHCPMDHHDDQSWWVDR